MATHQGHNTLSDVVRPFFPRPNNASTENLYFASMLALLRPWSHLQDIKNGHGDFCSSFDAFRATASQVAVNIMAGIQYYYECKNAAKVQHKDESLSTSRDKGRDWMVREDVEMMEENTATMDDSSAEVWLIEADLKTYEDTQKNQQEELHGQLAIAIASSRHIFSDDTLNQSCQSTNVGFAHGDNYLKLQNWQASMMLKVAELNGDNESEEYVESEELIGEVLPVTSTDMVEVEVGSNEGGVKCFPILTVQDHLNLVDASCLLSDQRHAYDIIDWHLSETLAGCNPPQLLMIIPGEGGVGKSKMIETITQNFKCQGVTHLLTKSVYTGIAASIVDGKTLHVIMQTPVNAHERS
ncbi:hypothetical protein PAXRUDRAFT_36220 [Paxillus rubicundulus Ve08.2h10]|uniref:DNA helicase n=1 Tax=Paxillus rubicundulus Ve08.2h10 TaxID=930991 RepID=A0A0D0DGD3_9AGAM|nr:hypothetical protein PAXRUDRAFT_36220 [Paxillus rubicundulus Ve08.2h10]